MSPVLTQIRDVRATGRVWGMRRSEGRSMRFWCRSPSQNPTSNWRDRSGGNRAHSLSGSASPSKAFTNPAAPGRSPDFRRCLPHSFPIHHRISGWHPGPGSVRAEHLDRFPRQAGHSGEAVADFHRLPYSLQDEKRDVCPPLAFQHQMEPLCRSSEYNLETAESQILNVHAGHRGWFRLRAPLAALV